jgi:hypothetical protein
MLLCLGLLGGVELRGSEFSSATLPNGVSVGFAVLRLGNEQTSVSLDGQLVRAYSDTVNRLLVDAKKAVCFGYSLQVEPMRSLGMYRVTVQPLGRDFDRELEKLRPCVDCPPPQLLPFSLPRFPPPRFVPPDVVLTLDLLVNPTTGEKIVDVILLSPRPITSEEMESGSAGLVEALELTRLGREQASKGRFLDAVVSFRKSIELYPTHAETYNQLGTCLFRLKRLDDAKKAYRRALDLQPRCDDSWNNLGVLYDTLGDYKRALRCYRKSVEVRPDQARTHWNMGTTLLALGQEERAEEALAQAIHLDRGIMSKPPAMSVVFTSRVVGLRDYLLARILATGGRTDESLAMLERAFQSGFCDIPRLQKDEAFKSAASDARFRKLTEKKAAACSSLGVL